MFYLIIGISLGVLIGSLYERWLFYRKTNNKLRDVFDYNKLKRKEEKNLKGLCPFWFSPENDRVVKIHLDPKYNIFDNTIEVNHHHSGHIIIDIADKKVLLEQEEAWGLLGLMCNMTEIHKRPKR